MTTLVRYVVSAGLATVTLDSPHNRNALSAQLIAELVEALHSAAGDPAVRVIVVTHTGPVFCSGADLAQAAGSGPAGQPAATMPALLQALWESPKAVVGRVGGPARAGGLGLLAGCDIVVCAREATFAFTEVRLGVVPALISATVLQRVQPTAARELFLTAEVFDGARAVSIGLANSAVPAERLDDEVRRYVDMLLRAGPDALAATKALLRRAPAPRPTAADLEELSALSVRHFTSAEGQEGIAARREKRDASWVPAG
ncbi:MAG: enoyl-CoA hydratase-related protein [Actinomycetota bacterium]|nr:enoyl-CoA hydratase-related protein [Actinomycetota bacterium]